MPYTHIAMIPGTKNQKLEPQMWNARNPLKKCPGFTELVIVSPVIEYENRAVCETRPQIPQAIKRGLVDIAVDARKGDLAQHRRFGASETFRKKTFDQFDTWTLRS